MTEIAKRALPAGNVWWGRLEVTEEGHRLLANPRFRDLMEEARRSGRGLTLEESNRRAGITEAEWAAADAEIDCLLAEQAAAEMPEEANRVGPHGRRRRGLKAPGYTCKAPSRGLSGGRTTRSALERLV